VTSDPQKHEVVLRTLRSSVRLRFTDEPWPIETPAAGDDQAAAADGSTTARAGRAIVRGLKKFAAGRFAAGKSPAGNGLPIGDDPFDKPGLIGELELEEDVAEEQADIIEEELDVIEAQREIEEAQQDVAEEQEP
jgi:hypothetical protein